MERSKTRQLSKCCIYNTASIHTVVFTILAKAILMNILRRKEVFCYCEQADQASGCGLPFGLPSVPGDDAYSRGGVAL